MELNEIWERGADKYAEQYGYENGREAGFIAGCEFEASRPKWFDPEKVLPEIDTIVSPLIRGHNESITVLVKTEHNQVEASYYSFTHDQWSCEDKVISWAYIPN